MSPDPATGYAQTQPDSSLGNIRFSAYFLHVIAYGLLWKAHGKSIFSLLNLVAMNL